MTFDFFNFQKKNFPNEQNQKKKSFEIYRKKDQKRFQIYIENERRMVSNAFFLSFEILIYIFIC